MLSAPRIELGFYSFWLPHTSFLSRWSLWSNSKTSTKLEMPRKAADRNTQQNNLCWGLLVIENCFTECENKKQSRWLTLYRKCTPYIESPSRYVCNCSNKEKKNFDFTNKHFLWRLSVAVSLWNVFKIKKSFLSKCWFWKEKKEEQNNRQGNFSFCVRGIANKINYGASSSNALPLTLQGHLQNTKLT